ncbi:phosphoserine phosphatase [Methanococcoides burtonii DSM 6242]|uniref:phosphoserine phosphatase n=2 Tax=Methanococcoides burtonii TaxID=29291 RepID=Q12XE9_METBU|nr:phosphoserine phosphatase [Methanococcoides burtonii DSM 6242]
MNSSNNISKRTYSKLIVFDMDSTLIDAESIDELARAAGVMDKVSVVTEKAMNGEIDYNQALKERVALLKGLKLETAMEAMDSMPLMPGAEELVKHVRSLGFKTAILSGGFTLSTDRVAKLLEMDYVFSNILEIKDGCLTGRVSGPMTQNLSKEQAFEQITEENGLNPENCIVVGDGANDICIFKRAGCAIAFNPKPILRQYADAVITQKHLRDIIPIIDSLDLE